MGLARTNWRVPLVVEVLPAGYLVSLVFIITASTFLMIQFFESFPNGWDQTEYAWAIKANLLPHSPYLGYFFLGKTFFWLWGDAAKALSVLAVICGLGTVVLLFIINTHFLKWQHGSLPEKTNQLLYVSIPTFLLATNYLFIRQSTTQEIYVVLLFCILGSTWCVVARRLIVSGVVYAVAIAVHNGAIFFGPAYVYLLVATAIRERKFVHTVLLKSICAAVLVLMMCLLAIYLLLPVNPDLSRWQQYVGYVRGISPVPQLHRVLDGWFLFGSTVSLVERLLSQDIPQVRHVPVATYPLGVTSFHALLAVAGIWLAWCTDRTVLAFWLSWSLPYLGYEILLGGPVDFGVYVVFVVPPLLWLCSVVVVWRYGMCCHKRLNKGLSVALVCVLLLPSVRHFARHWHDAEKELREHLSPERVALYVAKTVLPLEAVIIQPKNEWNNSVVAYYSERTPVIRWRNTPLRIFKSRGAFTPLNWSSFEVMTTELLSRLIESGVAVYALEADPLVGALPHVINKEAFEWRPEVYVDLNKTEISVGGDTTVNQGLAGKSVIFYRAVKVET